MGFTHFDPFEDTESNCTDHLRYHNTMVSPTSIRSRILKAAAMLAELHGRMGVSPTSIRSRILKVSLCPLG